MMVPDFKFLEDRASWVRRTVLDMAVRSGSGHVTTAFSQCELLVALYYGGVLRFDSSNPKWCDRDRFILSKGHGGLGIYPILADLGYFPLSCLATFAEKDSILGVLSEWNIPGIEAVTGSLGHGLPIATGMCEAARMNRQDHLVFCFLGDAELCEGSNWEAALFAGHRNYRNLVCIVDRNGHGVLGKTDDIEKPNDGPALNPIDLKFQAFGFKTRVIDGHDFHQIFDSLEDIRELKSPLAIIANTTKGMGVSVFSDKRLWHYRVPTGELLERAIREVL